MYDNLLILIFRGVSAEEADSQGVTALMLAAIFNRVHNVNLLMKRAKEGQLLSYIDSVDLSISIRDIEFDQCGRFI